MKWKLLLVALLGLLLAGEATAQVTLAWDPSTTVGVTYSVYRSKAQGACVSDGSPAPTFPTSCTKLNSAPVPDTAGTCDPSVTDERCFDDTSAVNGKFYYVVYAVDTDGLFSAPTNELLVSLPPSPARNLRKVN